MTTFDHPLLQGCGDHGCLIKKPTGLGTNASCRCVTRPHVMQVYVTAMRDKLTEAESQRDGWRDRAMRAEQDSVDLASLFEEEPEQIGDWGVGGLGTSYLFRRYPQRETRMSDRYRLGPPDMRTRCTCFTEAVCHLHVDDTQTKLWCEQAYNELERLRSPWVSVGKRVPEMSAECVKDDDGALLWLTNEEGSKSTGEHMELLELLASTFPIGTRVEIHTFEMEEPDTPPPAPSERKDLHE